VFNETGTIVGHVGDGNFHSMFHFNPNNKDEMSHAKTLADTISRLVKLYSHLCWTWKCHTLFL